jgi:hypothetical protein
MIKPEGGIPRRGLAEWCAATGVILATDAALKHPFARLLSGIVGAVDQEAEPVDPHMAFDQLIRTYTSIPEPPRGQLLYATSGFMETTVTDQYNLYVPPNGQEHEPLEAFVPTISAQTITYPKDSTNRLAEYITIAAILGSDGKITTRRRDDPVSVVSPESKRNGVFPLSVDEMISRGKAFPSQAITGLNEGWQGFDRKPWDGTFYSYANLMGRIGNNTVQVISYDTGHIALKVSVPKR